MENDNHHLKQLLQLLMCCGIEENVKKQEADRKKIMHREGKKIRSKRGLPELSLFVKNKNNSRLTISSNLNITG